MWKTPTYPTGHGRQVGKVLFTPRSVVYHKHRASSLKRFTVPDLQRLIQRNQFLFIWTNIHSWKLLLSHCLFSPVELLSPGARLWFPFGKSLYQGAARCCRAKPAPMEGQISAGPQRRGNI